MNSVLRNREVEASKPIAWDVSYFVSRAALFHVAADGTPAAMSSILAEPVALTWDSLQVLGLFSAGRTPREVFEDIEGVCGGESEFVQALSALVRTGLLVNRAGNVGSEDPNQFGTARRQHNMLKDLPRVAAYRAAISNRVAGKSVVDLGAGTGILSILAAHSGASFVHAIEESPIATVARELIHANGCDDKITVHQLNSRDVVLAKPADVLIHEIIGIDPLDENIVPYIDDARKRLLRPGGEMIPYRLDLCCLAFELKDQEYSEKELVLQQAKELDQIYGLNFEPYRRALHNLPEGEFELPIEVGNIATFRPRFLSKEHVLMEISFTAEDPRDFRPQLHELTICEEGVLGGLLIYFRAHLDSKTSLSNSPFAPPTSWRRGVKNLPRRKVSKGDVVGLKTRIGDKAGRQKFVVEEDVSRRI